MVHYFAQMDSSLSMPQPITIPFCITTIFYNHSLYNHLPLGTMAIGYAENILFARYHDYMILGVIIPFMLFCTYVQTQEKVFKENSSVEVTINNDQT